MNIYTLISLLIKNVRYLIVIPVVVGVLMVLLTMDQEQKYSSRATVFTGITSSLSLSDLGNSRVDFFATQNAYNNLLSIIRSQSVLEETALRLFASHLVLKESQTGVIGEAAFLELKNNVPEDVWGLVVEGDAEKTYQNLKTAMEESHSNYIYGLVYLDHPHYSFKALSDVKVIRLDASDIIAISYESNDAGICYNTIRILIEVFFQKHRELKQNQTSAVVEYFKKQLQKSADRLENTEDRLLDFNTNNQIINYYEQTKHISSQQEKIEVKLQNVQLEFDAAKAVLAKLEVETQSRFNVNLRNIDIMNAREKLITINEKIASLEIENDTATSFEYNALITEKVDVENAIKQHIDSLFVYERNSQGVEMDVLLNNWLKTLIEFESSAARLLAMKKKKQEFLLLYKQYAPLGAKLKRIKREIKVNEEEYLEILHHLGLAKLKQQNEKMMSKMKVIDKPHFPIDAMPTKRKVIIIIATFFSFIFTLLALLIFELLDKRVLTVDKLKKSSGLAVVTGFCKQSNSNGVDYRLLAHKAEKQLIEYILATKLKHNESRPLIIQFMSIWEGEGKTAVLDSVVQNNADIFSLYQKLIFSEHIEQTENLVTYRALQDVSLFENYAVFIDNDNAPDFLFVELPAISAHIINPSLFASADLTFVVVDAHRTWSSADNSYLKSYTEIGEHKIVAVLNKADPESLEVIFGDIPKDRSKLRTLIKQKLFKRFL